MSDPKKHTYSGHGSLSEDMLSRRVPDEVTNCCHKSTTDVDK